MSSANDLLRELRDFRLSRLGQKRDHIVSVGQTWEPFAGGEAKAIWIPTPRFDATTMLFEAPAGTKIDLHHYEPTESLIVMGEVAITLAGEARILRDGDCIRVAPNLAHSVRFNKDSLLHLLWTPAFPVDPNDEKRVLWGATMDDVKRYDSMHLLTRGDK